MGGSHITEENSKILSDYWNNINGIHSIANAGMEKNDKFKSLLEKIKIPSYTQYCKDQGFNPNQENAKTLDRLVEELRGLTSGGDYSILNIGPTCEKIYNFTHDNTLKQNYECNSSLHA